MEPCARWNSLLAGTVSASQAGAVSVNLFFHVIALHAVAGLRGRQTAGKAAPHSYTGARRHPTQNVRNLIDPAGAVINLFP